MNLSKHQKHGWFSERIFLGIKSDYATFLSKSKQGHFLQRLFSPFLNFLQQLLFTLSGSSTPNSRNILIAFFFFFLPKTESEI